MSQTFKKAKVKKRKKLHGFLKRKKNGSHIIRARRRKGRKRLSA